MKVMIDMEMPKCCSDCPILYDDMLCPITGTNIADWNEIDKQRLPDCPLSVETLYDDGCEDQEEK